MECFKCGNCESGTIAYFCPMKNDVVTNEEIKSTVIEKTEVDGKKGNLIMKRTGGKYEKKWKSST
jgi:hypothetical protein